MITIQLPEEFISRLRSYARWLAEDPEKRRDNVAEDTNGHDVYDAGYDQGAAFVAAEILEYIKE